MKTTKVATAIALTLLLATPAALAKDQSEHGKQKAKKVKKTRVVTGTQSAEVDRWFTQFDRNRDGLLTRSELPAGMGDLGRFDLNRDGAISRAEAQRGANDPNAIAQELRQLDRNRDGVVSRSEWQGDSATFQRLDLNRDGVLSRLDMQNTNQQSRKMRFRGMDKNRDGVISRREWRGNDKSFRNHDKNRDGILSGNEVR